jgi:excisionase family DNA binding protein
MGAVQKIRQQDAFAAEIAEAVWSRIEPRLKPVAKRLMVVREAAEYLGMSVDAIQHKVAARQIPVVRVDRFTRFDVADLDRWIADNKRFEE